MARREPSMKAKVGFKTAIAASEVGALGVLAGASYAIDFLEASRQVILLLGVVMVLVVDGLMVARILRDGKRRRRK